MKRISILFLVLLLKLTAIAQQTYKLDIKKSKINWKAPKAMGNRHYGFLLFNSGSLFYSAAGAPIGGTFSMNMNSIKSNDHKAAADNKEVDDEIKADDFFNVAQYPAAGMMIKQIVKTGAADNYTVSGDLTIKGVTKPIEFQALIKKTPTGIAASGALAIDRSAWNIKPKPKQFDFIGAFKNKIIAEEIPITLDLVFTK